MVVLGSGGHTKEMVRLVELLGPIYEYSYLIAADDAVAWSSVPCAPASRTIRPGWLRGSCWFRACRRRERCVACGQMWC